MKSFRRLPISPFLLSLYAVLSLWVVNSNQTPFFSLFRVLIITLVLTFLILLFFIIILRNWPKAGLASSLALLLFFSYGHIYNLIIDKELFGFVIGRHRYLLLAAAIIFTIFFLLILKSKKKFTEANLYVNLITLFLFAFSFVQAGIQLVMQNSNKNSFPQESEMTASQQIDVFETRDVYYIVMDAYSRQDLLLNNYGFDNSEFIDELTALGFVVPNCTLSNYEGTQFSISSSLNMNYFEQIGISFSDIPLEPEDEVDLGFIQSNLVVEKFRELGYKIVTFKNVYPLINIDDSDIYYDIDQSQPFYDKIESINFQDLFFKTTLLQIPIGSQEKDPTKFDFLPDFLIRIFNPRATQYYARENKLYLQYQFDLEKIKELPKLKERKFVYAHLLFTHQPFVFNPDGSMRESFVDSPEAYIDQIRFSNEQLIQIVKNLISKSDPDPVIIIQGDHSIVYQGEDRVKILNAYYLPDGGKDLVYPTITPVNTFRLIFNYYLGANLPMLPDHSYYRQSLNNAETSLVEVEPSCVK